MSLDLHVPVLYWCRISTAAAHPLSKLFSTHKDDHCRMTSTVTRHSFSQQVDFCRTSTGIELPLSPTSNVSAAEMSLDHQCPITFTVPESLLLQISNITGPTLASGPPQSRDLKAGRTSTVQAPPLSHYLHYLGISTNAGTPVSQGLYSCRTSTVVVPRILQDPHCLRSSTVLTSSALSQDLHYFGN